jgi:hypothetical protein
LDKYGNYLYIIEGSPDSIQQLSNSKQVLFRYWNSLKRAKKYFKEENISLNNQ